MPIRAVALVAFAAAAAAAVWPACHLLLAVKVVAFRIRFFFSHFAICHLQLSTA